MYLVATCLSVIMRTMCSRTDAVGVIVGASLRPHWSWGRSPSGGNSDRMAQAQHLSHVVDWDALLQKADSTMVHAAFTHCENDVGRKATGKG